MEDAIALVAVYLGETDEEKILDMNWAFFNRVLGQINRALRYDAAVGFAGNSFFKDAGKLIEESNPLLDTDSRQSAAESLAESVQALFNVGKIKIEGGRKPD